MQGSRQVGPLPLEGLRRLAEVGQLQQDSWVMRTDVGVWVRAASCEELSFPQAGSEHSSRNTALPRQTTNAPPLPPQRAPAAPATQNAEQVIVGCPACKRQCRISRPRDPAPRTCPHCKQLFRAAVTSIGVVARLISGSVSPTVLKAGMPQSKLR